MLTDLPIRDHLRLSIGIHMRLAKLPRWDLLREQNIQLLIRPVLRLREPKVGPYGDQSRSSCPEESCFARPIPSRWVDLVGDQYARDDVDDLVGVASQNDGLSSEAHG